MYILFDICSLVLRTPIKRHSNFRLLIQLHRYNPTKKPSNFKDEFLTFPLPVIFLLSCPIFASQPCRTEFSVPPAKLES